MESFYNHLKSIASELPLDANRIIIVGKGPSLKEVTNSSFSNSIIINVNDSEIYQKGHFTLFHADWIVESLKQNGFKNKYYISNQDLEKVIPKTATWLKAEYLPLHNEGIEHIPAFFAHSGFQVSDFLLVSALKFAHLMNKELSKKLPVYLIGFDFAYKPESEIIDTSGHDEQYKQVLFRTQKEYYKYLVSYLRTKFEMEIIHVGSSDVSDIGLSEFNAFGDNKINTPKKNLFDNKKAYESLIEKCEKEDYTIVVAELTNNHIGDKDRLLEMIRLVKQCGADMIKIQKRDVDTFYSPQELEMSYISPFGSTLGDYRRGVELNENLMDILISECNRLEICWFSSILDYPSLQFMHKYDTPLVKLPSTISNHRNFLKKVGDTFKGDLVISTGFTDKSYEEFVLENFTLDRRLFLLQCTSSYPSPPEACQIAVVRHYEELKGSLQYPNLYAGYSSHDLGSLGSMMAVAAGANMVEKHVKIGNLEWVHFDGVALDLNSKQFEQYVKDIRRASLMCGNKNKKIHKQEHHKYRPNQVHN